MILPSIYFTLRSAEVRSTVTWCVMCVVLSTHCLDRVRNAVYNWMKILTMKSFPSLMTQKRKIDKDRGARPLSLGRGRGGENETEPGVTKDAECFPVSLPLWPVNSVGNILVMGYLISQTSS